MTQVAAAGKPAEVRVMRTEVNREVGRLLEPKEAHRAPPPDRDVDALGIDGDPDETAPGPAKVVTNGRVEPLLAPGVARGDGAQGAPIVATVHEQVSLAHERQGGGA